MVAVEGEQVLIHLPHKVTHAFFPDFGRPCIQFVLLLLDDGLSRLMGFDLLF